jgi:hypothetical protein
MPADDTTPAILSPADVEREQEPLVAEKVAQINRMLVAGVRTFMATGLPSERVPVGHQPAVADALRAAGWHVEIITQGIPGSESTFLRVSSPKRDPRFS